MKSLSLVRIEDGDSNKVEVSAPRVTLFIDVIEFKSIIKVIEVL